MNFLKFNCFYFYRVNQFKSQEQVFSLRTAKMSKLLSPKVPKRIEVDKKYKVPKKQKIYNSINRLYYNRVDYKSKSRYPSVKVKSKIGSPRLSANILDTSQLSKSLSSHSSFRKINRRLKALNHSIGEVACIIKYYFRLINKLLNGQVRQIYFLLTIL